MASQEWHDRKKFLDGFIKPIPATVNTYDIDLFELDSIMERYSKYGYTVDMNPDYQRGHVWTLEQKIHYIENMLRFKLKPEIKINFPNYHDDDVKPLNGLDKNVITCIDGLQRYTALTEFVNREFKIFDGNLAVEDLLCSPYSFKSLCCNIQIYSLMDKNELLQFYIDLNSGGTYHTPDEIDRVKKMKI
ncbi:DUF262 domain-containing protein [Proteus mirabilis]|uniref:DUF262 domain-containing protein n=1 Tax=Proteus mirabilis TaxID=584 RepID=UPI0034D63807